MRGVLIFFLALLLFGCDNTELPKDVAEAYAALPEEIDYNVHVKKILSDKCFSCHGPDMKKQKADLRLDIASFAYSKVTESGLKAIAPGSLSKSELVKRILSEDADYVMPSPESHLELSAYEKAQTLPHPANRPPCAHHNGAKPGTCQPVFHRPWGLCPLKKHPPP